MGIPSRKGLTLIELIIVMVILAIMASVLYPDYRSYMLQRRLAGAALAVTLDLMLASSSGDIAFSCSSEGRRAPISEISVRIAW